MYRPMNFEIALQLFNIAASHMKFTNFSTSYQLKAMTATEYTHTRAVKANKWAKDWLLLGQQQHKAHEDSEQVK